MKKIIFVALGIFMALTFVAICTHADEGTIQSSIELSVAFDKGDKFNAMFVVRPEESSTFKVDELVGLWIKKDDGNYEKYSQCDTLEGGSPTFIVSCLAIEKSKFGKLGTASIKFLPDNKDDVTNLIYPIGVVSPCRFSAVVTQDFCNPFSAYFWIEQKEGKFKPYIRLDDKSWIKNPEVPADRKLSSSPKFKLVVIEGSEKVMYDVMAPNTGTEARYQYAILPTAALSITKNVKFYFEFSGKAKSSEVAICDLLSEPKPAFCKPGATVTFESITDKLSATRDKFHPEDLLVDQCPDDPDKKQPGVCGCGVPDMDTDNDGTADCIDNCKTDKYKIEPGICGCGVKDVDTDSDGTPDCNDACPNDNLKIAEGVCGCGVEDKDSDGDGTMDCKESTELSGGGLVTSPTTTTSGSGGTTSEGAATEETDWASRADQPFGCSLNPHATVGAWWWIVFIIISLPVARMVTVRIR